MIIIPNPKGSKTISLYYDRYDKVPDLNARQIKIIIEDLKAFLSEVPYDESAYNAFMQKHSKFKEVIESW